MKGERIEEKEEERGRERKWEGGKKCHCQVKPLVPSHNIPANKASAIDNTHAQFTAGEGGGTPCAKCAGEPAFLRPACSTGHGAHTEGKTN